VKAELAALIELQTIDLALKDTEKKKRDLPLQLAALKEERQVIQNELSEGKTKSDLAAKRRRELEDRLKREGEALKKIRERLYEVKTNKEYQAILKEIETAESKISDLESAILQAMEDSDSLTQELRQLEKETAGKEESLNKKIATLEKEIANLHLLQEQSSISQGRARKAIGPDILKKYDAVKAANAGVGLVAAWKGVCGGCHMNIQAQLYIDLQKTGDMSHCPNCQRIIYWYNQDESRL
jgi:predicted  nucleic acid-binding Zn-ribbon protein